jgi:hypothetical protein
MPMMNARTIGGRLFLVAGGASVLLYLSILTHLISPNVRATIARFYEGTIIHHPPVMFFLELAFFVLNYPAVQVADVVSKQDLFGSLSPMTRFISEYTIAVAVSLVWWGVIGLLLNLVVRRVTAKRAQIGPQ